jgi:protein SCO1/2
MTLAITAGRSGSRGRAAVVLAVLGLMAVWAYVINARFPVPERELGTLRFPISCGWRAQQDFTTATSLLHLFQFEAAEGLYRTIAARDPDCVIAYWGIAMSRRGNPMFVAPGEDDQRTAREALRRADSARTADPRERAYIAAAGTLFNAPVQLSWEQREVAYTDAMARVAADNPDDQEAAIFYALALNVSGRLPGRDPSESTHAAELLLTAFSREPDHPGIGHYLAFCLAHASYQPGPNERNAEMLRSRRISGIVLSLIVLVSLGVIGAIALGVRSAGAGLAVGGPFALTADDGSAVTETSFRPRWLLVYFGYTHCPDICPTTLAGLSEVLENLGPLAERTQPLFVTIDPERDDRAAVHAFVKAFDPRITGLTGTSAAIAAMAKEYLVYYKKVPQPGSADYLMEHSSYIYVMRPDGRYATLFTTDDLGSPKSVAARLSALLTQTSEEQAPQAGAPAPSGRPGPPSPLMTH